jgi:hypothetical protein
VYGIDQRLRGLPASREQVVAVYQSINQPHLAVPGRKAGPAQAYIVGLRGSAGLAVFVYLFLPEAQDCAVYVPQRRNLAAEEYPHEEQEAQAFVESMGFMMDNLNFGERAVADQEALLRSLPVFQKDPQLAVPMAGSGPRKDAARPPQQQLGRLLAAF